MTTNSRTLGPDRRGRTLITRGDRIASFGADAPAASSAARIPCAESRIEAGRINAHTHIYSGLAPFGIPDPEPEPENFTQILERLWWLLDRALDEGSLRASARYYVAQSLLAGTTTLIDHHESPNFIEGSLDVLADVCDEIGMAAVLTYGATERNGGLDEARRGLAECRRFILENRRPRVRGVVGLHASFTVSDQIVKEAGELCRELGTVMHVHMAEDVADVEDARRRGYAGPLERLLQLGALPAGSILAHGVHLDADQVRRVAGAGCWLVQNARSNHGNRVGYPRHLGESPRVAMGTDGYPSEMSEEAAFLAEQAAAHGEPPEVVEKRWLGSYALLEQLTGCPHAPLREGGTADAVTLGPGDEIVDVLAGGRVVVRGGVLQDADIEQIHLDAERQASRLWRRMRSMR